MVGSRISLQSTHKTQGYTESVKELPSIADRAELLRCLHKTKSLGKKENFQIPSHLHFSPNHVKVKNSKL